MIDGYIRIFRHWTELQLWGQMATTDADMRAAFDLFDAKCG